MKFNTTQFGHLRKKLRWSYKGIAEKINVSRKTISNWEKGVTAPSDEKIIQLAKLLGVHVDVISQSQINKNNTPALKDITKSWMSLFTEKEKTKNKINNISTTLSDLYTKLDNASIIIFGIINSLPFPVYIKNLKNNFIMLNKAFLTNVSINAENDPSLYINTKKNDHNFFANDEAKYNYNEDIEVMLNQIPIYNKEGFIPGSRKKKWGLISKVPIIDENNNTSGLIGIFVDITDRKNEEKRRMLLEKILNNVPLFVWLKDVTTGKIVFANDWLTNYFGIDKSELYNNTQKWQKIRNAEIMQKRNLLLANTKNFPATYTFYSKENSKYFRETVFKYGNRYQIGAVTDITHEHNITEIKNDMINLNDISEEIVTLSSYDQEKENWSIIYINEAITKLAGLKEEDVKANSKLWRSIIHPEDRNKYCNWYDNQIFPKSLEYRILHAETNKLLWVYHKQYKVNNKLYSHVRDITDRKSLERQKQNLIEYLDIMVDHLDNTISAYFLQQLKPTHKLLYVSQGYADLYGCEKESFYDNEIKWKEYIHPDDIQVAEEKSNEIVAYYKSKLHEKKEFTYRVINKFGIMRNMHCSLQVISKDNGKIIILGIIRPIEKVNLQ